jgi:hypothetical protein
MQPGVQPSTTARHRWLFPAIDGARGHARVHLRSVSIVGRQLTPWPSRAYRSRSRIPGICSDRHDHSGMLHSSRTNNDPSRSATGAWVQMDSAPSVGRRGRGRAFRICLRSRSFGYSPGDGWTDYSRDARSTTSLRQCELIWVSEKWGQNQFATDLPLAQHRVLQYQAGPIAIFAPVDPGIRATP